MIKKNNSLTVIGILGFGEIGKAIAKFYDSKNSARVKVKDLSRNDGLNGAEILHICIPWSDNFIKIAVREIKAVKPKLILIHSTVAPGTTKKISNLTKSLIVHTPVRGVHPYLFKGIKTFIKYIGSDNKKAGESAKEHLESLGIKTKLFMPSIITEIGKLLDTTYYGLCIAWHGEMKKICDKYDIDFEKTVTDFNKTYNEGYKKLGKSNVIRPVLYPPKGKIGGHCIVPNAAILKKYYKSEVLDFILKYRPEKRKNKRK